MIRTLPYRPAPADVAVAAGFAVFALVEEYVVRMPGRWWPYALVLFTVLVALRRLVPVLAIAVSSVAANATFYHETQLSYRLWQLVAMIIAAYTVGHLAVGPHERLRDRVRAVAGGVFVLVTALVYWAEDRTDPLAAFFFTGAPYALGVAVAAQTRRLAETATVRASIRERQAREAVMEERVRIARELHDMVAHSLSVMIVHADGATLALDKAPDRARQALRTVSDTGRGALVEMRHLVTVLRSDDGAQDARTSVTTTLDRARAAGLDVRADISGDPAAVPAGVELAAFRIVQESVTNALKHAGPGASAALRLAYSPAGVEIDFRDDGRGGPPTPGGHGLIGMRERVALYGGTITAGPDPAGGWRVTASIPVES